MYTLIRELLFALDAERSHNTALGLIGVMGRNPVLSSILRTVWADRVPSMPVTVAGLSMPNPVGLAAGLDKHAHATAGFLAMGFGSVELGTVTPLPQEGNPKPRMFRLRPQRAIINRMGFNSQGFDQFKNNFSREPKTGVIGINIGKNAATEMEDAVSDYVLGLEFAHGMADYVTINVSSPNTRNLRELQSGDELSRLLDAVGELREKLADRDGIRQPVFVKIAPDEMDEKVTAHIVESAVSSGIDGIINTNTTVDKRLVADSPWAGEAGGLSGQPLAGPARRVNAMICQAAAGQLAVIACGGISTPEHAWTRLTEGADSVQLYTSLIFQGPSVIREIVVGLERNLEALHSSDLAQALSQARKLSSVDIA